MPTTPLDDLLQPNMSKSHAIAEITLVSDLLANIVNFATHFIARCGESVDKTDYINSPVFPLYLHMIEMTDGTQILIAESCPLPAMPLVRSSLEALLSMDYIMQAEYERRSLSWLVGSYHDQLVYFEKHDPDTPKGQVLQKAIVLDKYIAYYELPLPGENRLNDFRERAAKFREMLNDPVLEPIEAEFQRIFKKKRRQPRWYELFEGPKNLRELAIAVQSEASYLETYSNLSGVSHAESPARFINAITQVDRLLPILRDPSFFRQATIPVAQYLLKGTKLMDEKFHPVGEAVIDWYAREIHGPLTLLTKSAV